MDYVVKDLVSLGFTTKYKQLQLSLKKWFCSTCPSDHTENNAKIKWVPSQKFPKYTILLIVYIQRYREMG